MRKSKLSSAASSRRPLESVTFFIDRSLGARLLAVALRSAGANVQVHDDHFPQEMLDTEWLSEVGRRGWVAMASTLEWAAWDLSFYLDAPHSAVPLLLPEARKN